MFSLEEGSIALDPNNASPEAISSGADVANFSVAATFDNPINGTFRDFSYGVKFREADGLYHAISINSDGDVRYLEGAVGEDESTDTFTVLQTFDYSNVGTTGADSNSIHLTVIEDQAWLFVNGDFFVQFTVEGVGVSSDVQLIAELENETQISGVNTQLTGVAVRSGEAAASVASTTMIKEQGEITRTEPTGTAGTFLVEAEFVSGYERILGKWTVGFEFTDPASETTNWILINNSKQWKQLRRVGPSGPIEEIAGGLYNGILRDRGDVNKVQVLSQNGIQQLFINGSLVANVDIQPELVPVQIAAFSGFAETDQQPGFPTEMRNYAAWTFGS